MIKINGVIYYGEEAERRSEQMLRDVLEPEPQITIEQELHVSDHPTEKAKEEE